MQESPFTKVFSKAHIIVPLLLVIGLLETTLKITASNFVRALVQLSGRATSRPKVDEWSEGLVRGFRKGDEFSRSITFTVTHPTVEIDLAFLLPASHPIANRLTSSLQDNTRSFVDAIFGDIQVDDQRLGSAELGRSEWSVSDGVIRVHIHAIKTVGDDLSVHIEPPSEFVQTIPLAHDTMTIRLERAQLLSTFPTPDFANGKEVQLVASPGKWLSFLNFVTRAPTPSETSALTGPTDSPREMLKRLALVVSVPFLSQLLYSPLLFLPFLLFLRFDQKLHTRETKRHPLLSRLVSFVVTTLRFGLVLTLVTSMWELLMWQGWLSELLAWPHPRSKTGLAHFGSTLSLDYSSAAIVGILAPMLLFLRYGEAPTPAWLRMRKRAPFIIALLTALSMAALFLADWQAKKTPSVHVNLAGSLALPGIYVLLLALSRTIGTSGQYDAPASLAALLFVVLVALGSSLHEAVSLNRASGIILTALAGGFLTYGWIILILREFGKTRPLSGWPARVLFLGCTALAVPLLDVTMPGAHYLYTNLLLWLGYQLVNVIILVWVAGIIWYFYRVGRDSLRATGKERLLGVLVASSILFVPTAHWCFVPISFLLGFGTLHLLVVRPSQRWFALLRRLPSSANDRREQINAVLDLNAAENGYTKLRQQLREKLEKGESDFKAYEEKLAAERARLQSLQDAATKDGLSVREVALAYGPRRTAWDNAMHGTWCALAFATPWLVIGISDLLTSENVALDFPLWSLIHGIVALVARWAIIGFFFGYFYLYLPGRSGLSKGFYFFLAIALPALPLAGLQVETQEQWRAITFSGLQTFIECMLLGLLAFDYATLQRSGQRDWRLLFEVHDLPSLGVSVSSILVAIGGAITALISSNASALVSAALRFILPQVPLGK